jgi:hypothetical protein
LGLQKSKLQMQSLATRPLAFGPNYFVAAWMDSSNGVDMQEEVGGIRLK